MTESAHRTNPFSVRRWEFETDHVVWVPAKARDVLGQIPCHIQGVRGSGKTAILRIADYYTRRSNRVRLFNESNIIERCLGVYVSFVEEFTDFIDSEEQPLLYYDYTLLYCLSKVFDLLDDASRDDVLSYSQQDESHVVRKLTEKYDIRPEKFEKLETFSELASFLRRHCRRIRNDALTLGLNSDRVESSISGLDFFDELCGLLREWSILESRGTHFFVKICVDDAHLSSAASQRKLNNILYRSKIPIFWNIAYVEGQFDPYDIDNRVKYLTGHDREFVDLNYRDDPSTFQEICERIFEIRVSKFLVNLGDNNPFDSQAKLRTYIKRISFEDMFSRMFERSKKTSVTRLVDEFTKVWRDHVGPDIHAKKYQLFLASFLFNDTDEFALFCAKRDSGQIENYFRQKGGASLVVGARKLERAVPYEGLNTLLFLSDGCLRDFLSLCAELFELDAARKDSQRIFFRGNMMASSLQTKAFRGYSERFIGGLHNPRQPYAQQLAALVEGIGTLSYMLQTEEPRLAIMNPDLGLYRLEFDGDQKELFEADSAEVSSLVREVLKEGIYTGAIRLEQGNIEHSDILEFRLSGVLCPHFQTSPRRATRRASLTLYDLHELIGKPGAIESRDWARKRFQRWADIQKSSSPVVINEGYLL